MVRKSERTLSKMSTPKTMANYGATKQPRMNVRGAIKDQTVISGNYLYSVTTNVSGNAKRLVWVDMRDNGAAAVHQVGRIYQEYKFLPGSALTYSPSVSITSPGSIAIAYIDNPEVMAYWNGATITDDTAFDQVARLANAKIYPIWQQFTYAVPNNARLKVFNVNKTLASSSAEELGRSTQGCFVIGVTGLSTSTTCARGYFHENVMFSGLMTSSVD